VWNWIAPPELKDIFDLPRARNFAALMFALTGRQSHAYFKKPVTDQSMLDLFTQEVKNQCDSGTSIIMESEEVDWVIHDKLMGQVILGRVLSILPPGYEKFTTVVINYRAPRIDYLLSLWETVGVVKKQTCYQFISDPVTVLQLHAIDPIRLANIFLE